MKTRFLAVLALSVLSITQNSHAARESTHGFGLGFILGDPTAITAKQYLDHNQAFDLGFGYDWGHSVMLYGDYLFHFPGAFNTTETQINRIVPYVSIGPKLEFIDSNHPRFVDHNSYTTSLSARIPLGLNWSVPDAPIEIFAEIVPVILLIPGLTTHLDGGVGARYFF